MAQTGAVLEQLITERRVARYRQLRSLVILIVITIAMFQDEPRPGLTGRGAALLAAMTVASVAWVMMALRIGDPRRYPYAIGTCMAMSVVITLLRHGSFAGVYALAAVTVATACLSFAVAAVMTGTGALLLAGAYAAIGAPLETIVIWSGAMVVLLLLGTVRREREGRAEQDRLLAGEQARTAALAERARLAREIHDVLAHSLSALSLQLETAAALLERDRAAEAATIVDRAGRLARDGLTETRRAVSALRGDPVPLPELLRELTAEHEFALVGEVRELSAETGLALYRSAQEALTNVRKHAPGSRITVRLEYTPDEIRLTVRNTGPSGPPTTGLSSGYGLQGLRERAELAGGTFEAGPCEDGWQVDVRMPG
ncbi:sensor histidine kinase [Dactylosporangium vinaceum]|uniref:histidine kinase n=1 Tax=Dactylosporangium vinaceum TaxID=53362 RepID=A0ABV5M895_9ACTN|nr:histidine kinase [Dactylosporangium vinaceum]UAB94267.1 sensor histidine kinase [Dactylosporangium vinaceum]